MFIPRMMENAAYFVKQYYEQLYSKWHKVSFAILWFLYTSCYNRMVLFTVASQASVTYCTEGQNVWKERNQNLMNIFCFFVFTAEYWGYRSTGGLLNCITLGIYFWIIFPLQYIRLNLWMVLVYFCLVNG